MENKKIKICLGLLTNRGFKKETVISLLKMVNESQEYEWFVLLSPNGYTIAENRNWLVAQAIKNNCDFILMVDDDMIFPPFTAKQLISRGKDIIGIPYHVKTLGKEAILLREFPNEPLSKTEPNEVLAIGTGVSLFKCSIFLKIPQPWFDFERHPNGMVKQGEDYYFCNKAYAQGFKLFVEPAESFIDDTGKDLLGHVGDYIF